MFGIRRTPQVRGNCSCEDLNQGNQPTIRSTHSPALTAAMMGWDAICKIPDYDELARDAMVVEEEN